MCLKLFVSVFLDVLIDFVYPKSCCVCGKLGESICKECLVSLEYSEQICPECGELSILGWTHKKCFKSMGLDGLVAIYDYQDEKVRKLIDDIKFGFNRQLIKTVLRSCEFEVGSNFDLIVPIPLYFYRQNWRGFNQAKDIANSLGENTDIPEFEALRRIKATKQQSMSLNKKERENNIKEAFMVLNAGDLKGKRILLVDDVFTSGASMKEACRVLKSAGAEFVWGFALAH